METYDEFLRLQLRPFPIPYIEWHFGLYDTVTALKQQLERLAHEPILSENLVLELGVIQGAELIIDDGSPVDLGPLYFRPDNPHVAAQRAQRWNEVNNWPTLTPDTPEIIVNGGNYPIQTGITRFEHVAENIARCLKLVDWEIEDGAITERFVELEHICWLRFV